MTLASPAATLRFGTRLAAQLHGGEVVALSGDLGAGKTHLIRGIAEGLGAAPANIASPTFVFVHEYRGRIPLAHFDLYRIETAEELDHLGWADYLDGRWVVAIEWAERAAALLPADRLEIRLDHRGPRTRVLTCTPTGPTAKVLAARLHHEVMAVARGSRPGRTSPARPRRAR